MSTHWDQFPPRESAEFQQLIEEGYREMGPENLRWAQEAFPLIAEVVLRDDEENDKEKTE